MKILVVGSGGREHAIAWKMSQNDTIEKIYCAPGNAGTERVAKGENISIDTMDEIVAFAEENSIDLTIVGSEEMLVEGIVDRFQEKGLTIFGPNKQAALLEGSKAYAKEFMKKYGVKTAAYETFSDSGEARSYLETCDYPIVIKASGLAAGKGVIICQTKEEALTTIEDVMDGAKFGSAGAIVVIEEFLEGVEASILSVTDSRQIVPFISAKDHKKIGEGETGLNTGGMGVIAPNPYVTEDVNEAFIRDILNPTLEGIRAEGMEFCGVIFFGLMINDRGVYLIEYNMRMGDPETQVVLPLLETDLYEIFSDTLEGRLDAEKISWKEASACCVVAASGGYPESYNKGCVIRGTDEIEDTVFMAGAKYDKGNLLTNGGRVLNVVSLGDSLDEARAKAYSSIKGITFDKMYYRRDIGRIK